MTARHYQFAASASLIALIFLCLGWELWWAPLKPGGSWLGLKAVLLLAPLFEGLVRATSDSGLSQKLAIGETLLAAILFVSVILYIRATRGPQEENAAPAN